MFFLCSKKRYFAFVFLLVFLVFIFPCHTVIGANSSDNLKQGMSGSKVLQLQKDLKTLGFFKAVPTGFFGDTTKASVINFQKKYKIPTTGTAGPLTMTQINTLLKKSNTSRDSAKSGVKIVIDPGHGGIDPGTSKGNVVEKEVNLDIAKMLQNSLDDKNHNIVMTRTKDISLYKLSSISGTNQVKDLDARVNIINNSKAKLFVSIHVNSLPESPGTSGSIVFYNGTKSRILALSIQKALNNMTVNGKQRQRNDIKKSNFYILKNSSIPGVLVETAFITNKAERTLLSQKSFREKIAKTIASGIESSGLY